MDKVTKQDLEQYMAMKDEIRVLQLEIKNGCSTTDSVQGSMTEYPYIQRVVKIQGRDHARAQRLDRQIEKLQEKCANIEQYVDDIKDYRLRAIIRQHYLKGLTWDQAVAQMGTTMSWDAARKRVERFFQENS